MEIIFFALFASMEITSLRTILLFSTEHFPDRSKRYLGDEETQCCSIR